MQDEPYLDAERELEVTIRRIWDRLPDAETRRETTLLLMLENFRWQLEDLLDLGEVDIGEAPR